jgi:hypothetical protein
MNAPRPDDLLFTIAASLAVALVLLIALRFLG